MKWKDFDKDSVKWTSGWAIRIHCIFAEECDSPNECPVSDGETPVMQMLLGMLCTLSMPSLPGQLWLGVIVSDMGSINGSNGIKQCT